MKIAISNRVNCKSNAIIITVVSSMFVSGCANSISPQPPDVPAPADVRKKINDLYFLETGNSTFTSNVSATTVAIAGYQLAEEQCTHFFSAVSRWKNDASFNRKEVTLAGAAAAGILAALQVSAQAIALTAIGFALTADSIDNFQNFALFTTNAESVSKLVTDAMATYRQSAPPGDGSIMVDVGTAQSYISNYAQLCTYRKIQDFIAQALAKATPIDVNQNAGSIFSTADKLLLASVNDVLGLPKSLLSDEQYEQLYWYLKSAYLSDINRGKVLAAFSAVSNNLWDSKKKVLPSAAQTAAQTLSAIALTNSGFSNAEKALESANPSIVAAPAGAAAAPVVGGYGIVSPQPTRRIPNIQIQ